MMPKHGKLAVHKTFERVIAGLTLMLILTACGSSWDSGTSQEQSEVITLENARKRIQARNVAYAYELLASGRKDKAIKHFTFAIDDGFRDETTYAARGNCKHTLGFLDSATADYQQALTFNKKNATALSGLADISLRKAQPTAAMNYCKDIPVTNQTLKMLKYGNEGQALAFLGNRREALTSYQTAIEPWKQSVAAEYDVAVDVKLRLADLLEADGQNEETENARLMVRETIDGRIKGDASAINKAKAEFKYSLKTAHLTVYSQDKLSQDKLTADFVEQFISFIDKNFCSVRKDFELNIFIYKDLFTLKNANKRLWNGDERWDAFYRTNLKGISIYNDCGYGLLAHEVMHAINWANLLYLDPWAVEGIPTFFEILYGYKQPLGSSFRTGYQNAQRMKKLWKDVSSLSLKHYVVECIDSPVQNESANRLIAMFLHKHGKLVPYLELAKHGKRGQYMTMLEATFDKNLKELEPLWNDYLTSIQKRRARIEKTPASHFFANRQDFELFFKENEQTLKESW